MDYPFLLKAKICFELRRPVRETKFERNDIETLPEISHLKIMVHKFIMYLQMLKNASFDILLGANTLLSD